MDLFYKISHAQEQIDQLDVEVHHVATYIHDEDHYLDYMEEKVQMSNPHITHQSKIHHLVKGHFHSYHRCHLFNIAHLPGFSGDIQPGISKSTEEGESMSIWKILKVSDDEQDDPMQGDSGPEDQWEADEEEEAEEAEEELVQHMASILTISQDQIDDE